MSSEEKKKCFVCNKTETELNENLKYCAKCRKVAYCSRDCQAADWKTHKKACAASGSDNGVSTSAQTKTKAKASPAPKSKPRFAIDRPFTALTKGTWLSSRPEADVYQLLSDVFRLRRDDEYTFSSDVDESSIYGGGSPSSELRNYRRFLTKITKLDAKRAADKKLLPSWWSTEKIEQCCSVAMTDKSAMIEYAVEKSDIQDFYGQADMPMQLRMLGEKLDGFKTAGQSGATMLAMRAGIEGA